MAFAHGQTKSHWRNLKKFSGSTLTFAQGSDYCVMNLRMVISGNQVRARDGLDQEGEGSSTEKKSKAKSLKVKGVGFAGRWSDQRERRYQS